MSFGRKVSGRLTASRRQGRCPVPQSLHALCKNGTDIKSWGRRAPVGPRVTLADHKVFYKSCSESCSHSGRLRSLYMRTRLEAEPEAISA